MCGIVGYYLSENTSLKDASLLKSSVEMISHRGPDDSGTWTNPRVGLGSRRLAIQDLSRKGRQPMTSEDGRYVLVFNGEIYNFNELRKELEAKGEKFRTGTDTEVLLRLYERRKKACLSKLNGMFSFAVYDTKEEKVFLARDRFGIKPQYILNTPSGIFFASEMKSFLPFVKSLDLPWGVNEEALHEQFLFRYRAGLDTLAKGVTKCSPGGWIEIDKQGRIKEGLFYDLREACLNTEVRENLTLDEQADYVKDELKKAIKLRLVSDAPLGVALSGGVDSSLITALMREVHTGPIKTFSVTFGESHLDGREIDESAYSDYVANKFQTDHHKLRLDQGTFCDLFTKCLWHNDEPINHPHAMGIFLLSRFAVEKVKVLLGGEGADEVFAGYTYFKKGKLHELKNRYARISDIQKLAKLKTNDLSFRKDLINNNEFKGVNKEVYYSVHTYLQSIENRLDKMSMAVGLEARAPFLDHNVVESSFGVPDKQRVKGGVTKAVLKKLAERYIPYNQIYRPKVGFSVPLNSWLRDEKYLGKYVSVLEESRARQRGFIREDGLKNLLKEFRTGKDTFEYSVAGRVWILLNLELWIRTFIEDKKPL